MPYTINNPFPMFTPGKPNRGGRRRNPSGIAMSPTAPVLTAATVDLESLRLTLTFDQTIDVDGFVPSSLTVEAGKITGESYTGSESFEASGPGVVEIALESTGASGSEIVTLTASAANGIVGTNGGLAWAGVTNVELPFAA